MELVNEKFEIQENDVEEQRAEERNQKVRCWVGTWNNPKMTDEEFKNHLLKLYYDDYMKYAIFQREKGEESGIEHFQFFVDFKNARTFKWVKENLPYGCHFKPMRSTKTLCKNYCSKTDTRISESYCEIGEFIEERQRTDLTSILDMIKQKIPFDVIQEAYPTQCIMYKRQLQEFAQGLTNKENKSKIRDVKVYYLYGEPGCGKTSLMVKELGLEDTFLVDTYDKSMFTLYNNEKNIVFDEFTGKVDITYLNKLLDRYPVQLRGLNVVKMASYTTVWIISNLSINKLYLKVQEENPTLFKAFQRRVGCVMRMDNAGVIHYEKNEYDKNVQIDMIEIDNELPFADSDLDF